MKLVVASKKVDNKWEAALVVDNKFQRALVAESLDDIVLRATVVLAQAYPEGTDVLFEVTTSTPDEQVAANGGQK